jgi:hypothetical protein
VYCNVLQIQQCNEKRISDLHERATRDAVLQADKNVSTKEIGYHGEEVDSLPEAERGNVD